MDTENKTIDSKLKDAQEILDEFESIHNLNTVTIPTEIDNILSLTYQQLEKMPSIQCTEYGYVLSQYAYYIQRVYNKESATNKWIKEHIDGIVAGNWFSYDQWIKYEIRVKLMAKENAVLAKLVKLSAFFEQKMERMSFLAARIDKMADMIERLGRAKGFQRG